MNKGAFIIMLCAIAGSVDRSAFAFESDEHTRMGDLAFSIAHKIARTDADKYASIPAPETFFLLNRLSYGDIARCVDYFLFPEKLVGTIAYERELPSPEFLKRLRDACTKEGIKSVQATHGNQSHFQQDLLTSLELWHRLAIALRKENDNGALWVNAISDHYLHDMFAPGHIVTPRNRMTDVPATAMHDKANRDGALFVPLRPESLKEILDFVAGDRESLDELRYTVSRKDKKAKPEDEHFSADDIRIAVESLIAKKPIVFRGDKHLWDHDPEQLKQRVWLLAVEVRSILDVFDDTGNKDNEANNITGTKFTYDYRKDRPTASFLFGEYKFDDPSMQEGDRLPKTAAHDVSAPQSKHLYVLGDHFNSVGISAHREHQSSGARTGRNVASVEASVFSETTRELTAHGYDLAGALNITGLIGYSYYWEGSVHGAGPTIRIPFAVPETEFSTGPYFRWLSYQTAGGEERKVAWGWRVDQGFSGYFTIYLGLGKDYGANEQGVLQKGYLWQGGIQAQFPISRLFTSLR